MCRFKASGGCALALTAALLGGCATGATSSITQAPLFLSDASSVEDAPSNDEGSEIALAPAATRERGVPNYNAVSGNALLPVNAVLPLTSPAVVANVLPGNGTLVDVNTSTGLPVSATLNTTLGPSGPALGATVALPGSATGVNVSTGLAGAPSALAGAPAAGAQLITSGALLGAPLAAQPAQPVNALLNNTSTTIARICVLKVCR